ncbi:MAG TPA: M13 family metallopeptidase [Steroidobacteraceae bacterium]
MKSPFLTLFSAALLLSSSMVRAEPGPISGIQTADMDKTVRPQDDLFQYANGTWLRDVPIPADRAAYGVDSLMTERSLLEQRDLIEAAQTSTDPEVRKISDLYSSYMNEAQVERLGVKPLRAELELAAGLQRASDIGRLMGRLDRIGIATPLATFVRPDSRRSAQYAFWITQSGLGLPDRDYYLSDDARLVGFRTKYREHVEKMLRLLHDDAPEKEADKIVALETAIAKLQWTRVANRDAQKTYNPKTLAELAREAPAIDWDAYVSAAGLTAGAAPTIVVRQPDYLQGLSSLIESTPMATWTIYFRYRVLSSRAPFLPRAFVEEDFAFNQGVLQGTQQAPDRWKRGTQLVDRLAGEASGKLYVAKYFPPATKARIDELVRNLLKAYAVSIDQLAWMSAATKVEAQAKLRKINVKIGYPDHWRDYGALKILPADLLGNVRRAQEFERNRKLAQLGGPVDRAEWNMTAPTVNAYYNPSVNEIVFPAGILQPPAFDPAADDAFNYGSAGATIGHEISHGFDDQGSQYDSDGNLRDWWTPEDHAKFKAKTALLIKEYDAFEPVPGFHVNGALTLGENIADIAGIEIAYKAYMASLNGRAPPIIDGMTADQRFFIGFAQSWLGKRRDESTIAQVKSDPHSPEKYRTNGVVVHMPSFYSAFSVTAGDKMYLPPDQRVTLW